jgi:hypothetical protein
MLIKDFRQKTKALIMVVEVLSQVGEMQGGVQIMQQLMSVAGKKRTINMKYFI